MAENIYPLQFSPVYKDYIWGGERIMQLFKRPLCPLPCAESWEISDRQDGMSIISNGMLSGASLHQIVESMTGKIIGMGRKDRAFPILVKLIDAHQRLSLQVHPDSGTAEKLGGDAKTEMWYILAAEPGAKLFAGFKHKTSPTDFEHALKSNQLENLLNQVPVRPGDSIYLPAGTLHAIGEGCLILEVQQNSNTTYRVYDWNRVDSNGKPRELHIPQAMKSINWEPNTATITRNDKTAGSPGNHTRTVVASPFFKVSTVHIDTVMHVIKDECSFHVLFNAKGSVLVEASGSVQQIITGTTCLIPAAIEEYKLTPLEGNASLITITLPDKAS